MQFEVMSKTKKAVERNIEIIGEAINRILKYKNKEKRDEISPRFNIYLND